jgi:nucleoside-diphosphate-sugar epimerase
MKALVIGGTGPTGPYIVNGLLKRGYDVAIMHRGTHDTDEIPSSVERIIGDPHFQETLSEALGKRTFDLVIATYGRIRLIAAEMSGRTQRFIAIGGPPCFRGMMVPEAMFPSGMLIPTPEDAPLVESEEEFRFSYLIRLTEDTVMKGHQEGHYCATLYRYPVIYGPRLLGATMQRIIRLIKNKRPYIVLPDGGLTIVSRGYAENMGQAVLLSVDNPDESAGQIFNCADDIQFTVGQWISMIASILDYDLEVISVPDSVCHVNRDLIPFNCTSHHQMMDTYKIRTRLGYKDVVSPLEALSQSVRWCLDHPLSPELAAEKEKEDALNYRIEDELAAIYRDCYDRMASVEHPNRPVHHPYPHPKEPGLSRDHRKR